MSKEDRYRRKIQAILCDRKERLREAFDEVYGTKKSPVRTFGAILLIGIIVLFFMCFIAFVINDVQKDVRLKDVPVIEKPALNDF